MSNFYDAEFSSVEPSGFSNTCYEIFETFAQAISVTIIIFSVFFRTAVVSGDSMYPTLHDHDKLYIWQYRYVPERGDIITVTRGQNVDKCLVKRVIGKGGDTVDLVFDSDGCGQFIINGVTINEPYINGFMHRRGFEVDFPMIVPEGYLFVAGDNRDGSSDSRFAEVGLIKVSDVVGKPVWIFFPPYRFGAVH